ncbi:MAG: hypothetical protein Q7R63_01905 [bacterium]|nr:hypothetical protein [bacterium]
MKSSQARLIILSFALSICLPSVSFAQQTNDQNDAARNAAIVGGTLVASGVGFDALASTFKDVPIIGGLFEQSSKAMFALARKRFFDMVVDQMVNWIQGGGKPLFIENWNGFLAQYGNIVTGDLLAEMKLAGICRPFGMQLQIAVLQPPRFSGQVRCTLDQVVRNMTSFYANFSTGGFVAYREQWQPRNNFYGGLLLLMDEKEARIADKRFAGLQEAQAGGGFLSQKICDANGEHCRIVTPGMQVGAAAAKLVGTDLDYIIGVSPDDFAAYTAAISDAFINRLIREGVSGFQGVVSANAPQIGYVPAQPANAKPCSGLTGDSLNSCKALEGYKTNNATAVKASYMNQIEDTLTPLLAGLADLLALQTTQQTLVNKTSELNNCQIGRGTGGRETTITALAVEQKALADITTAVSELQQNTTPLTNAKNTLMNETSADLDVLASYMTGPAGVGRLINKSKAEAYAAKTKADRDALTARSATRLPELQTLLQRCISS